MMSLNLSTVMIVLFRLLLFVTVTSAHSRLECPPPRTGNTGAKTGPCDAPDDLNLSPYPLHPGLNTVTWLESVSHPGAPGRFALSLDGSDDGFESCILLDHVPHDEHSGGGGRSFMDELQFHRSSITLFIPDVKCDRCNLQFISVMSDDIHGLPDGEQYVYEGAQIAGLVNNTLQTCDDVYHSCAPVSINGTIPRNEYVCSLPDFVAELEWPFMEGKPPASTYFFKGNPGLYDLETAQIKSGGAPIKGCSNFVFCEPNEYYEATVLVPEGAKYAAPYGTCAAAADMKVEPFVLSKVPSIPKDGEKSTQSDALEETSRPTRSADVTVPPITDDTAKPNDEEVVSENASSETSALSITHPMFLTACLVIAAFQMF